MADAAPDTVFAAANAMGVTEGESLVAFTLGYAAARKGSTAILEGCKAT
jgi:hypothetical protein